jgi:hypothetical protein
LLDLTAAADIEEAVDNTQIESNLLADEDLVVDIGTLRQGRRQTVEVHH